MIRRSGSRWLLLGLALSGATGCTGEMDGTWVFQWDRANMDEMATYDSEDENNAVLGPECVEDGSYPTRDLGGTSYSFVEIYLTQGTGIVVSLDGQDLVGSVTGNTFEAESSYKDVQWEDEDTYTQWEWIMELNGELVAGEIDGKLEFKSLAAEGFPSVECEYKAQIKYNAVKLTTESKPDRGTGTEGSGIPNISYSPGSFDN